MGNQFVIADYMDNHTTTDLMSESCSYTEAKLVHFTHQWTVNHFSFYLDSGKSKDFFLQSSRFNPPTNNKLRFYLTLFLKDKKKSVGMYLYLESGEEKEIVINYKVSIIDQNGAKYNVGTFCSRKFISGGKGWGWPEFICCNTLLSPERGLLPDDKLTIHCEIGYLTEKVTLPGPKTNLSNSNLIAQQEALQDISNLLQSGIYSDVVLCVGDTEWKAHKNILASRCSVFAAMFDSNLKESVENRVQFNDIKAEAFHELLKYIYGANIESGVAEYATELLAAADKYQLNQLKVLCEESLCSKLSVDSTVDLLVLADMHGSAKLKARVIDYIALNVSSFLNTHNWKSISKRRPKLFNDVLCILLPKLSQPIDLKMKKRKRRAQKGRNAKKAFVKTS